MILRVYVSNKACKGKSKKGRERRALVKERERQFYLTQEKAELHLRDAASVLLVDSAFVCILVRGGTRKNGDWEKLDAYRVYVMSSLCCVAMS